MKKIPFPYLGPTGYLELYEEYTVPGNGFIFYRADDGLPDPEPFKIPIPEISFALAIIAFLAALAAWIASGGQGPMPQPAYTY